MPIRPPADDGWNEFMQAHNANQPDRAPSVPLTRGERRAIRKREHCHFCGEPLLGTGKPMSRKRWRCDVEASCTRRQELQAQRDAYGL